MKNYECPNCGNDMNDTEEKCRYCGTANPIYSPVNNVIKHVIPGSSDQNSGVYSTSWRNGHYKKGGSSDQNSEVYSGKSRIVCGILQLFFGGFGIGRFYSGHTGIAVAQLLATIFTCGFAWIWGVIDGILILVNTKFTDSDGKIMN